MQLGDKLAEYIKNFSSYRTTMDFGDVAMILPVKNDDEELNAYAHDLYGYLLDNNIRADIDERAEKLGYRVREAQVKKIPYLIILGKQEAQDGTVSYRLHGQQNTTTVSRDEFLAMLKDEIATKKLSK